MKVFEILKNKKMFFFQIFLTLYIGINLIGGERGLLSYFKKNNYEKSNDKTIYLNAIKNITGNILNDEELIALTNISNIEYDKKLKEIFKLKHQERIKLIGITENTDSLAIIVSEERGKISIAQNGKLEISLSAEQLKEFLQKELHQ